MLVPNLSPGIIATARAVWEESIANYGRDVTLTDQNGELVKVVKAFVKRPKILGLWDRAEQSYDQERYMLIVNASDFAAGQEPAKFFRANWDNEDHIFISVTQVDLSGTVFGYRILVKG